MAAATRHTRMTVSSSGWTKSVNNQVRAGTNRRMGGERRRPTIRDVAERAGVSTAAVSFGLNGRPGVGADTRERIFEAAAELGWTPTASARALRRARADAVFLVIARDPELL